MFSLMRIPTKKIILMFKIYRKLLIFKLKFVFEVLKLKFRSHKIKLNTVLIEHLTVDFM